MKQPLPIRQLPAGPGLTWSHSLLIAVLFCGVVIGSTFQSFMSGWLLFELRALLASPKFILGALCFCAGIAYKERGVQGFAHIAAERPFVIIGITCSMIGLLCFGSLAMFFMLVLTLAGWWVWSRRLQIQLVGRRVLGHIGITKSPASQATTEPTTDRGETAASARASSLRQTSVNAAAGDPCDAAHGKGRHADVEGAVHAAAKPQVNNGDDGIRCSAAYQRLHSATRRRLEQLLHRCMKEGCISHLDVDAVVDSAVQDAAKSMAACFDDGDGGNECVTAGEVASATPRDVAHAEGGGHSSVAAANAIGVEPSRDEHGATGTGNDSCGIEPEALSMATVTASVAAAAKVWFSHCIAGLQRQRIITMLNHDLRFALTGGFERPWSGLDPLSMAHSIDASAECHVHVWDAVAYGGRTASSSASSVPFKRSSTAAIAYAGRMKVNPSYGIAATDCPLVRDGPGMVWALDAAAPPGAIGNPNVCHPDAVGQWADNVPVGRFVFFEHVRPVMAVAAAAGAGSAGCMAGGSRAAPAPDRYRARQRGSTLPAPALADITMRARSFVLGEAEFHVQRLPRLECVYRVMPADGCGQLQRQGSTGGDHDDTACGRGHGGRLGGADEVKVNVGGPGGARPIPVPVQMSDYLPPPGEHFQHRPSSCALM